MMLFHPLQVLAHVERRRILAELSKRREPIAVPAVDTPIVDGAGDAEILNDIFFYHLPKMAEHGYVTFDSDDGTVDKGPRFDALRPYLRATNGHRDAPDRE